MTACVISQPRFFPGLHYLHRMLVADIFVILDTVQYTPRHEENRTKVKTPQGAQWLTVPVNRKHREQRIVDTTVEQSKPWATKAIKTLNLLYGKAPYYQPYAQEISELLSKPYDNLSQLNWATWQPAIRGLDIACRFVLASDLPVTGQGSALLLNICRHLQADTYISGAFGRDYLERSQFAAANISIKFHDYRYPEYAQRFEPFVPFLSYLDMLFNTELDREIVMAGGQLFEE